MKKVLLVVSVLCLMAMPLWAGHADKAQMETMKAEMAKCIMCKNMLPAFDQLMPVMQHEVVKLDNGMAMVCTVTDASKVKLLHEANAKMAANADACMALSDADAPKQLCTMCQDIRTVAKAGAVVGTGTTKNGTLLVLTSSDPKVQTQLASFQVKCAEKMTAGAHSH